MSADVNFFKELEKNTGIKIPQEQKDSIKNQLEAIIDYEPKIGLFGKTGAGKSSLCNALFGQKCFEVDDVESCTRDPQEVIIHAGGERGLKLLDVPGIGESKEKNIEYGALYNSLLPELDAVLWLLIASERAYAEDEAFYKNIVKPHIKHGLQFFFVVNQIDKIEPVREWDVANREPSANQLSNIERKREIVSITFDCPKSRVIPVSANEKYNLVELVNTIVHALPRDKRIGFYREVSKENRSEISRQLVVDSWMESVHDAVYDATGNDVLAKAAGGITAIAEFVIKGAFEIGKGLVEIGKALIDFFKF